MTIPLNQPDNQLFSSTSSVCILTECSDLKLFDLLIKINLYFLPLRVFEKNNNPI